MPRLPIALGLSNVTYAFMSLFLRGVLLKSDTGSDLSCWFYELEALSGSCCIVAAGFAFSGDT
ncbi:MAG: hypothetical protein IJ599_05390 [Alphaproteobacteria bacterium]|nr:hypothetical protein [Alphaproteobacteria bacterium]